MQKTGEEKQAKILDELTVAANEWASRHGWGVKSQLDFNQEVVYFLIVHPDKSLVTHYVPLGENTTLMMLKGTLQSIAYICRKITNYSVLLGVVNTDKAIVAVLPDNTNITLSLREKDDAIYIVAEIKNKTELTTPAGAIQLFTNIIELYIEATADND